jgi:hypothetical protein
MKTRPRGWGWLDVLALALVIGSPVALVFFGTLLAIVMLGSAYLVMYYIAGETFFENAAILYEQLEEIKRRLQVLETAVHVPEEDTPDQG